MKMGIQEFGDALIRTRDLDPVYVGLVGAKLDKPQLARWLLAYWCFYHVGAASCLSELTGNDYWLWMINAAANVNGPFAMKMGPDLRWPRAPERRHFRGEKCVHAVEWLRAQSIGVPEAPVMSLTRTSLEPDDGIGPVTGRMATLTEKDIMSRVQEWPMFGPWVAFKAADMMERVWGLPVAFDRNLGLMYEEPRAALTMMLSNRVANVEVPGTRLDETWYYNRLLTYFSPRVAPPEGTGPRERACGPQEVETILCKWKSHMGGHYWVGKDVHEQRQALAGWGQTAERVLRAYPSEVPAQEYA